MRCFFVARLLLPKRDIGGIILSMAVPVVFIWPSRRALSMKRRVSSGFSFSSSIVDYHIKLEKNS